MHAIIMGAGEGSRMWPISTMVNKHLLKLGGKPVIRHIVDKLVEIIGKYSITIVCLEKDLKDYQWEFRDLYQIKFDSIKENKGTADEFYDAMCNVATSDNDSIFLHYGDTITDLNYGEMIKLWNSKKADAMIAITQNIKHDYSEVHTGAQGMVYRIVEKPNLTVPSWTGIGIFRAGYFLRLYNELHTNIVEHLDFGYHVLPAMAKTHRLWGWEYNGKWFDVGNLRSYQKLYKEYQNKDLNL